MPSLILVAFAAVLGAVVGSFLNVCICRWPADESVVRPASRCPECSAPIAWRDNVPVFSWLVLRGRCRQCGTRISWLYPVIEIATAVIWAGAALRFGFGWQALTTAVFFTLLLGIAATDARTYIIPDEFSLGGLGLGLLLALAPGGLTFTNAILGAVVGFGFLYVAAVVGEFLLRKPAMGGGDIKMMAMVGAFLGPWGALLTIFFGALVGSVVFLPLSLRGNRLVPFGLFLAVGAALAEAWGGGVVDWYRTGLLGY